MRSRKKDKYNLNDYKASQNFSYKEDWLIDDFFITRVEEIIFIK